MFFARLGQQRHHAVRQRNYDVNTLLYANNTVLYMHYFDIVSLYCTVIFKKNCSNFYCYIIYSFEEKLFIIIQRHLSSNAAEWHKVRENNVCWTKITLEK